MTDYSLVSVLVLKEMMIRPLLMVVISLLGSINIYKALSKLLVYIAFVPKILIVIMLGCLHT